MISFSSSKHLFIRARRFRSSSGLVIFLYWCVLERGTSESECGETSFWSGEESEDDTSRLLELTRGEKAEKELCQFMVSVYSVTLFSTLRIVQV